PNETSVVMSVTSTASIMSPPLSRTDSARLAGSRAVMPSSEPSSKPHAIRAQLSSEHVPKLHAVPHATPSQVAPIRSVAGHAVHESPHDATLVGSSHTSGSMPPSPPPWPGGGELTT